MAHLVELHPGDYLVMRVPIDAEPPAGLMDLAKDLKLAGVVFLTDGSEMVALTGETLAELGLQRIPTRCTCAGVSGDHRSDCPMHRAGP